MDANTPREEIFRVEIQADAAIRTLADYNTAIAENTEKLSELKKANEQGTEEYAKLTQVLATQKRERNELQKVIQNDVKLQREEQTSLKGMRAALSNLTKQYDELSAAERDGAKGDELRQHINKITTELKAAEEETQRYYRNVGNYEQSVKNALRETKAELTQLNFAYDNMTDAEKQSAKGREMARKLEELTEKAGKLKDAMDATSQQVKGAASDTRAFDTLNEAAQLCAASYGLMQTAAVAFGASEKDAAEVTKKMAVIMQTINSLQTIQNLLQKESNIMRAVRNVQTWASVQAETAAATATTAHGVALGVATAKQAAFNAVANANPYVLLATGVAAVIGALVAFSGATEESTEKMRDAEQVAEDFGQAVGAAAGKDLAAANTMYNAAIRAASGTEARKKALEALQKAYPSYFGDLNTETATISALTTRYNELTAAILANAMAHGAQKQLEKESEVLAKLNAKYTRLSNERAEAYKYKNLGSRNWGGWLGGDKEESGEERYKRLGEELDELDKQITNQRKNVDAALKFYVEAQEKADREAAKMQKDLEDKAKNQTKEKATPTAKGTTAKQTAEQKAAEKAAEDAKKKLERLRNELLESYAKLQAETAKSSINSVDDINNFYDLQLSALKKHFADLGTLSEAEQTAYDGLYNNIIAQRDKAVAQFLKDADENEQRIKAEITKQDDETLGLQIENAAENSPEKMALELQLLQMQYEQKLQLHKGNEEMLTALTAENERKRAEIQERYAEAQREILYTNAANVAGAMGNAAAMLEKFAGKSKAAAVAAKSLAVGEILVNQGVAVAKGINQAQSVPFPANIAAIATTIAAILSGVTSAMRAVNSAKFATGGYISGAGTSTSDSIPARLSNGESVINANSTALFTGLLSALNQIGGGVPIQAGETAANVAGEAMLARAFAMGAAALPAPVVSVVDINTTAARLVQTKERATL